MVTFVLFYIIIIATILIIYLLISKIFKFKKDIFVLTLILSVTISTFLAVLASERYYPISTMCQSSRECKFPCESNTRLGGGCDEAGGFCMDYQYEVCDSQLKEGLSQNLAKFILFVSGFFLINSLLYLKFKNWKVSKIRKLVTTFIPNILWFIFFELLIYILHINHILLLPLHH